jgi:hypothetical protein
LDLITVEEVDNQLPSLEPSDGKRPGAEDTRTGPRDLGARRRSGDPEDHWLRTEQEVRGTAAKGDDQGATTAEDKIINTLGDFA